MVRDWFREILTPKEACGPLCQAVQDEIESIGRAQALRRRERKHDKR